MRITRSDDHLGHQTPRPLSHVALADTEMSIFTERFWYMGAVTPSADTVFGMGLGYYPNREVMDGYFAVVRDGIQYNVIASRSTGDTPHDPTIGPIRIDIEDGMRKHRLRLADNASGVRADLTFTSDRPLHDEGRETRRRGDVLFSDITRFVQTGNYSGTIDIRGDVIDVSSDTCIGARDRSWGLRIEANTDESIGRLSRFPPIFFAFLCVQFPDFSIHFFFKENADGTFRLLYGSEVSRDGQYRAVASIGHDITWRDDPFSQYVDHGAFYIRFKDGYERTLQFRNTGGRLHLKGGLYGGLRGWAQGAPQGALRVQCDEWSFDNPEHRRELRTLAEQVLEVRTDGAVGYGTLQAGVAPGYSRYQEVQHLPPM